MRSWYSTYRRGPDHPAFGKLPAKEVGRGRGGFVPELGHYVRSTWEANVARWLKANDIAYVYEPQTFRFGDFSYTPDFYLPTFGVYLEVKGWWSAGARRKFDAFCAIQPRALVIGPTEYAELGFDPQETR